MYAFVPKFYGLHSADLERESEQLGFVSETGLPDLGQRLHFLGELW